MTEKEIMKLAYSLNRSMLGRENGLAIDESAKQWFESNLVKNNRIDGNLIIDVLSHAIVEMTFMYELASRSGVTVVASMIQNVEHCSDEYAMKHAETLIHEAGERLIEIQKAQQQPMQ